MTDTLADDAPRPMTEAPRDGTKVLAWWPPMPHSDDTGAWITTWWGKNVTSDAEPGWENTWEWERPERCYAPTHFLPHPGEPK